MELILANHSSYPRIGDDANHQLLRRTIAQRDKGEKTDADVRTAEDRVVEFALREQLEAGLEIVTDGQIRWYDPISHLAGKLEGVRINGLLRFFDTNFYFRQPVVTARPERTQPLVLEEFRFAQAKSASPVKAVLMGPYTLARLSLEEKGAGVGFEELLEAYTQALGEEVEELVKAGASLLQIEEPLLLKRPDEFHYVERALTNLAMSKGQAQLALALYFGDPAELYDQIQTLPVDVLMLDFTYNQEFAETIATRGCTRTLGLGLVNGRNTRLEDAATVARQIEKIANSTKAESAYLQPSCGLEYLPRDRAQLKLRHLTTIKNAFLGRAA